MRALTIANANDADTGFIGDRFREHGYAFDECHRESAGEWPALDGHELILLLGSEWSVYWPQVADKVQAEVALLQEAARRDIPVFGICFGNQVMAHAFGGTVHKAEIVEIGWQDIETDIPDVIAPGPWMEWHYDVVTIPPGAIELARTAAGPQAWQMGRMFCTQFHPEVHEGVVRRWATGFGADELARIGSSPEELIATTRASIGASRVNAERLVDWFCETIAQRQFTSVQDLR
jgi:GMP synthase-like glutamine amidotransferase